MKKTLLLFLTLSFGLLVLAQNSVVLCTSYNDDGITAGIFEQWEIEPTGGYIYLVYNQEKIIKDQLQVQMDKLDETTGNYVAYFTGDMSMQEGKNWAMYDLGFSETGKYIIKVMKGKKELANTNTEIFLQKADKNISNTGAIDTYYYENSVIKFGTSETDEGLPVGENTEFSLGSNDSITLRIFLTNDKVFATDKFYVDVYDDEDDLVDAFTIKIDPEWDQVRFNQWFTKRGEYIIDIFNADDIFINSGEVTIK
ncbi:MAG: hypothetical protein IPG60_10880 [Bacteroidetes bacterium]|nr:hypothetical protein [Bacteroidota bacterium]